MRKNIEKDSFVVVSDFHSNRWPFEKVKNKYLKQYDKIFILGDATDRGRDAGIDGISLLIDIMDLCKQYPGRVVYVPGNHDKFLYDYAYGDQLAAYNLERNGGANTKKKLDELRHVNPSLYEELIEFIGRCPIQVKHTYRGQKYSLAHAFFDQTLYNQKHNFCLRDFYYCSPFIRDRANNVLWFRKGKNDYDCRDVVVDSSIVVVGHTPERYRRGDNLNLRNRYNEEVIVHCVDGGIDYDGIMHKFDGGKSPVETKFDKFDSDKVNNYILDQEEKFKKCVISFLKNNSGSALYPYFYQFVLNGKPVEFKEYLDKEGIDSRFLHVYLSKTGNKDKRELTEEEVKDFVIGTDLEHMVISLLEKYDFDIKRVVTQISGYYKLQNIDYISSHNNAKDIISHIEFGDIKHYFISNNYSKVSDYVNKIYMKYINKKNTK